MSLPLPYHLFLYVLYFVFIWIGAGFVIDAVSALAHRWRLSRFFVSFFLLGIFTSLPEITISSLSIIEHTPEIMVGSLLGGALVILLCVIPLLGIAGNGVRIPDVLGKPQLLLTLLTILAPALLTADRVLHRWEGVVLLILYTSLFIVFSVKLSLWQKVTTFAVVKKRLNTHVLIKAGVGIFLVIVSSHQIINTTIYFAELAHISPFFISLLVIAIGTNIPEFSLIIRSLITKKADIALGDYLGSAAANTLIMGASIVAYGQAIYIPNHIWQRLLLLIIGIVLFFVFARSRKTVSRAESFGLLALYVIFVFMEISIVG